MHKTIILLISFMSGQRDGLCKQVNGGVFGISYLKQLLHVRFTTICPTQFFCC